MARPLKSTDIKQTISPKSLQENLDNGRKRMISGRLKFAGQLFLSGTLLYYILKKFKK